jgi:hypothetical protein
MRTEPSVKRHERVVKMAVRVLTSSGSIWMRRFDVLDLLLP